MTEKAANPRAPRAPLAVVETTLERQIALIAEAAKARAEHQTRHDVGPSRQTASI